MLLAEKRANICVLFIFFFLHRHYHCLDRVVSFLIHDLANNGGIWCSCELIPYLSFFCATQICIQLIRTLCPHYCSLQKKKIFHRTAAICTIFLWKVHVSEPDIALPAGITLRGNSKTLWTWVTTNLDWYHHIFPFVLKISLSLIKWEKRALWANAIKSCCIFMWICGFFFNQINLLSSQSLRLIILINY